MRYTAASHNGGIAIHDSVNNRFVGNGKGDVLVLPYLCQSDDTQPLGAMEVIGILVQRVGA